MFDPKILADRSILVTGGGSGLGLAMAKKFAAHGAKVTIAGRTLDRLEKAAREIAEVAREGGEVDVFPADVREPDEVDGLVEHVVTRFGKVDSLVNNAAGNFLVTSEDLTPNGFDAVVKTVLHGSVFCTLAVGRHLLARQAPGSVVSVVTTYAWTGTGFALPSACAKAGVLAMTRSLAVEWGHAGIRLNAVAPGPIPTEGAWARLMAFPEAEKNTIDRIPLGRLGTPGGARQPRDVPALGPLPLPDRRLHHHGRRRVARGRRRVLGLPQDPAGGLQGSARENAAEEAEVA